MKSFTIQQRQRQMQYVAALQKRIQMGSGQMLSSDWASFAGKESDILIEPLVFFTLGEFFWIGK